MRVSSTHCFSARWYRWEIKHTRLEKSKETASSARQSLVANGPPRAVYNLNFLLKRKKSSFALLGLAL